MLTCYTVSMSITDNTPQHNSRSCTGMSPETVLKSVFGYSSFRPLQKEIISNVLSGRDTLAVMPTGGGKSLTYQIPALIFDGVSVVISPLIALMQDQVTSLAGYGIHAVFLNSSLEWSDYLGSVESIRSGQTRILYVSPEGLATQRIREILHDVHVCCFTVDEAHCISEWGHDFRPDYLGIAGIREQFPGAVCLALTATATKQVRSDILKNLRLKNPAVLVASFNRPNIYLEVQNKRDPFLQVSDFLGKHKDESGIIYCFSRKQVDQLVLSLRNTGFPALGYHAGLSPEERTEHQDLFIHDKIQIMVATVAFGMGIDKPNVRFVIHYDMPKSLEQYYQEIGRAGRDGLPAEALLLYSPADIHKIRYFFDSGSDSAKAEILLQGMIKYATCRSCRRRMLLAYFGETFPESTGPAELCCDICECGPVPEKDVTIYVQKFMSCMLRTGQRFGMAYIIDVLLGSRQKRIVDNGHNKLSTWGIGTELGREDWFELGNDLIEEEYIEKTEDYGVLSLTASGRNLLASRQTVLLPVLFSGNEKPLQLIKTGFRLHKKMQAVIDENDREAVRIASELRRWRQKQAEEENVPPYVIFGDKTLADIACVKPDCRETLLTVYGIGEVKAEKFGSAIIRIVKN